MEASYNAARDALWELRAQRVSENNRDVLVLSVGKYFRLYHPPISCPLQRPS